MQRSLIHLMNLDLQTAEITWLLLPYPLQFLHGTGNCRALLMSSF